MFKQSRVNSWGGFLCIIIIWLKKFHLTVPTSHALGPSTTALFSHFAHNCRHQTILLILHNYKSICSISQINSKILHNYNLIPILSHHQTPSFIFIYNSNTKLRYGSTIYHVLRVVISLSFFFFFSVHVLIYFILWDLLTLSWEMLMGKLEPLLLTKRRKEKKWERVH